jgi:23S rRNA pseudouridine955/2504/2580 synthase
MAFTPQPLTLTAAADDDGRRLDRILRKALPDMPLSAVHSLLRKRRVLVNGVPGNAADRVRTGSVIQVPVTGMQKRKTLPYKGTPLATPDILWEGAGLLVLNKPAGLVVHGPGCMSPASGAGRSLEAQVQDYLAPKLPPSLSFKPGPLHRLDKPTSGIIVFSTSLEGARDFSAVMREGRVRKTYLALLAGILDRDGTWEDALIRDLKLGKSFTVPAMHAGPGLSRTARTRVYPLAHTAAGPVKATLVRLELDTGRTHQIRVQAAARGFPLAGDRKYGDGSQKGGFLLHAWTLELPEHILPEVPRRLEAPLPENFRGRIQELFGKTTEAVPKLQFPKLQLLEQLPCV